MKKGFLFSTIILCFASLAFTQTNFSGTFVNPNGRLGLMFTENTVLIHGDGNPIAPPLDVSISGNSIRTQLPQSAFNWTIIDTNTIIDGDGESYTRVTSLSGTFNHGRNLLTFTGNNFSFQYGLRNIRGTYTISGIHLFLKSEGQDWRPFVIVSRDVIRDAEGDSWRK